MRFGQSSPVSMFTSLRRLVRRLRQPSRRTGPGSTPLAVRLPVTSKPVWSIAFGATIWMGTAAVASLYNRWAHRR